LQHFKFLSQHSCSSECFQYIDFSIWCSTALTLDLSLNPPGVSMMRSSYFKTFPYIVTSFLSRSSKFFNISPPYPLKFYFVVAFSTHSGHLTVVLSHCYGRFFFFTYGAFLSKHFQHHPTSYLLLLWEKVCLLTGFEPVKKSPLGGSKI